MSKTYSAGIVTAYGAAKRAGYHGTYEDFCRQQAGYAESAATVEQAKTTAVNAASTATAKAGEATTAATAAQTAKTQTEAAASQALTDISTARSGAISAVQIEGQTQTANARAQAQAAAQSATTASTKASEASASATSAGQSATNAAASAASAAQSASNAQDVLDSIPADYSDLSANVSQLQADLTQDGVAYDDTLTNDFYHTAKRLNSVYGRFDIGALKITKLPDGFRAGLQGYTKSNYSGSYSYNSGWITSVPFEVDVNPNLYYMIQVVKNDFSDVSDVSIANNGFEIHHLYTIGDRADFLDSENANIRNAYMPKTSLTVKSIAHRGDCVHGPQNTAPAYIMAKNHGIDIAENDVSLSNDNEYVMWHDLTLERLGNLVDISGYEIYTDNSIMYYYDTANDKLYTYTTQYVESAVDIQTLTRCIGEDYRTSNLTLAQLKRIDFGVYKGSAFKGTQILTFEEWVLLCKQIGMDLYIDFRISISATVARDLNDILIKYGMQDHATWANVSSTTEADTIRAVDTKARLVTFNNPTSENIATFAKYNTGRGFAFDGNGRTLTQAAVQLALEAGIDAECYYVEYANTSLESILTDIRTLVSYGISSITIDYFRVDEAFVNMLKSYPQAESY